MAKKKKRVGTQMIVLFNGGGQWSGEVDASPETVDRDMAQAFQRGRGIFASFLTIEPPGRVVFAGLAIAAWHIEGEGLEATLDLGGTRG